MKQNLKKSKKINTKTTRNSTHNAYKLNSVIIVSYLTLSFFFWIKKFISTRKNKYANKFEETFLNLEN